MLDVNNPEVFGSHDIQAQLQQRVYVEYLRNSYAAHPVGGTWFDDRHFKQTLIEAMQATQRSEHCHASR